MKHIILLPKDDFYEWVKAAKNYILKFGVHVTYDPIKSGGNDFVTVVNLLNGFPNEGDVVNWINMRFPDTLIDAVEANSQKEFGLLLQERITNNDRFGGNIVIKTEKEEIPPTIPDDGSEFRLHWPTEYDVVTQPFLANPQIYSVWRLPGHEGIDIRALENTKIFSCADGIVTSVENDPDVHPYGKHVRIMHRDGYRTVYAHLAKCMVKESDVVKAKQVIGLADSTGNSTGSHLHLTVKKEGATERGETQFKGDIIDPTPLLIFPD
jgi:murein DD-endopeptidase MepM/ murein hydrolase activator NlpD